MRLHTCALAPPLTRSLPSAPQEFHEVQLVLRMPRASRRPEQAPAAAPPPASGSAGREGARGAADTAVGVDGIELREQTHEEALLSTIGTFLGNTLLSLYAPVHPDSPCSPPRTASKASQMGGPGPLSVFGTMVAVEFVA